MKDNTVDGEIIPLNDRNPSLEEKVAHFLATIPTLPKNERKPVRSRMPDSSDAIEQRTWCREELRRIREGHFGMSGKMYFWYNYVKLQDVESGTVRPEFRVCQAYWFDEILRAQNSREFGLIGVKRRRIGASWLETADVMHDIITTPGVQIGMTSKSEADAIALFKKAKFIYDHLPPWLRPTTTGGNTRMHMDFSYKEKDAKGNWIRKGNRGEILVKAPTETSWEGFALYKYVSDEAGKDSALKQRFVYTEPALMKGTRRVGCPIIFGTAGDITKDGADFREMFYNADSYKLNQFFFGGWMGLDGLVDDLGNDMVEEAVRWIVYERFRRESLDKKTYNDFIQQYPLTIGEAFTSNETYGIGNSLKINKQINALTANPPQAKRGYFKLDNNQKPVFVPTNAGACIIYEEPEPLMEGLYLSGGDTSDHEVKNPEASKNSGQCIFIMKKRKGTEPPKIVFEYYDKPAQPRDFYDQALMALMYYGNAKIMIERNRYGMITYFDENGFKHLLATKPQGYSSMISGTTWNIGYYRDARTKKYGEECWSEYIDDYIDWIPSVGVLKESLVYGQQNTDRCFAPGTPISTLYGIKPIEDVTVDDFVLTHTGEYKRVLHLMNNPHTQNVVSIKAKGLPLGITCTHNHPIYVAKRQGPDGQVIAGDNWKYKNLLPKKEWIDAGNLRKGDYVLIPKRTNLETNELSFFEMYLLGWYLSDGYLSKNQVCICFQGDQLHIAEWIREQLISYDFNNLTTEKAVGRGKPHRKLPTITKSKDQFMYSLTFTSMRVKGLIKNYTTKHKTLTPELFNTANLLPLALGYFEGDGSQSIRVASDKCYRANLTVASVNFDMVYQIHQILIDNGIWCTLSIAKSKRLNSKDQLRLDSQDWENLNKLLIGSLKFSKFAPIRVQNEVVIRKDEGFWVPVASTEVVPYNGSVYNFEVADDNTYVAGGFVVHNCASIMATMIYLKEDKWEATPRANGETLFKKKLIRTASGGVKRVLY